MMLNLASKGETRMYDFRIELRPLDGEDNLLVIYAKSKKFPDGKCVAFRTDIKNEGTVRNLEISMQELIFNLSYKNNKEMNNASQEGKKS